MDKNSEYWKAIHDMVVTRFKPEYITHTLAWCEQYADRELDLPKITPREAAQDCFMAYFRGLPVWDR